jgi:hypothetical protein
MPRPFSRLAMPTALRGLVAPALAIPVGSTAPRLPTDANVPGRIVSHVVAHQAGDKCEDSPLHWEISLGGDHDESAFRPTESALNTPNCERAPGQRGEGGTMPRLTLKAGLSASLRA